MNLSIEHRMATALAAEYRKQGYAVELEPAADRLPFSLGNYRPDLLVEKAGEHLLIEIKRQALPASIGRLRDIAEAVRQQPGWRFLYVGSGPEADAAQLPEDPLSWADIARRIGQAQRLREAGDAEAAILLGWSALEALLRRHAETVELPLEHLAAPALLDYLYSEADLSFEHFEEAKKLLAGRNQLAHGFPLPEAPQQAAQLQGLVEELSGEWLPLREAA